MKQLYDNEKDGFCGLYWPNKKKTTRAVISLVGDSIDDFMARKIVKWLKKYDVNVMTMSVERKSYSYHNFPLERIKNAIEKLKELGNDKIGIAGGSTTGTLVLTAASYFSDISLTLAFSPSDFIWQGFEQGKKDGCDEWPVENESLFTYQGKPLPYMPFVYQHPDYWRVIQEESKKNNDMINSKKVFDDSEKAHPIQEEEFIKVENIKGKIVFIGAKDDCLWDTCRYIDRAVNRLKNKPHACSYEALVYDHGTHFIFPQSLVQSILPVISSWLISKFFSAAKGYKKECKETRIDIEHNLNRILNGWIKEE